MTMMIEALAGLLGVCYSYSYANAGKFLAV